MSADGNSERVTRTMGGLRETLIDEIDRVRNGQSTPAQAKSVAMLAKTALESIHIEIQMRKFVGEHPVDKPLQLTDESVPAAPRDAAVSTRRGLPCTHVAASPRDFADA